MAMPLSAFVSTTNPELGIEFTYRSNGTVSFGTSGGTSMGVGLRH
jgi:hypothetical protein